MGHPYFGKYFCPNYTAYSFYHLITIITHFRRIMELSKEIRVLSLGLAIGSFVFLMTVSIIPSNEPLRRSLSEEQIHHMSQYLDAAVTPEYNSWMIQQQFESMSPQQLAQLMSDNEYSERRRLQDFCFFCGCCTDPPAEAPSVPPTPAANALPGIDDDTAPYIYVDFGANHISYETANSYCKTQLGTTLASLDTTDTRNTQSQLIAEMDTLCRRGSGSSCWIGLLWSNKTNDFNWENGQVQTTNNNIHPWQNGEPVPASALGIQDFCVVLHNTANFQWKNIVCHSDDDAATKANAALCGNPIYIKNPTLQPTQGPTPSPSPAPTPSPTPCLFYFLYL